MSKPRKSKKLTPPRQGARFGTIHVRPVRDGADLRWQLDLNAPAKTWPASPVVGPELHRLMFFEDESVAAESARASAQRLIDENWVDVVYVEALDRWLLKKTQEYVVRREGF